MRKGTAIPAEPWLIIALADGLGPARIRELLARFHSAEALVGASRSQLLGAGLDGITADALLHPDEDRIARSREWLAADNRVLIGEDDDRFPPLLREAAGAPCWLFVNGEPELLSLPQIAIVGSRSASPGGADTAARFAGHLAEAGFVITSGLALGIDAAAHCGALDAGGHTIAVAATGPDRVYPAVNRDLAQQISTKGAVVSEFPPGTPVQRSNFPRRNRIISGLATGVLVVEAGQRSGALITARHATEQAREVFAVPGSIHSPLTKGCHRLIREGATLVETGTDIVDQLGSLVGAAAAATEPVFAKQHSGRSTLDPEYQNLLAAMGWDPVTVDLLVSRAGLTAEQVSSMLLILEMEGCVDQLPGGRYQQRDRADPA